MDATSGEIPHLFEFKNPEITKLGSKITGTCYSEKHKAPARNAPGGRRIDCHQIQEIGQNPKSEKVWKLKTILPKSQK